MAFDRQTGEVIFRSDDFDLLSDDLDDDDEEDADEDEESEIRRAIDEDEEDRYIPVPSLGSHEGFRIMERFAAAQEGRVREALFDALDRRRPFRSFKDALLGFPDIREAWFRYHEERLREEALDWLRAEGIDAELTTPSPPD